MTFLHISSRLAVKHKKHILPLGRATYQNIIRLYYRATPIYGEGLYYDFFPYF